MRMEELANSIYVKGIDTVERYLLNLVHSYFRDNNVADVNSREFIIREAVARMKEELRYENIGVLSVTLADNVPRTGAVNVGIEDLGAEPAIDPKLSAFNVDFGDKANTACEGNDPRLSDSRDPKPHTHNIQDINGLEGRLSTLLSIVNRASGYAHVHNNSNVLDKLVYSGSAATIDLNFIDTLLPEVTSELSEIRDRISDVTNTEIPNKIREVDRKLQEVSNKIEQAEQTTEATHQEYLEQAKSYVDTKIPSSLEEFNRNFDGYMTEAQLSGVITDALFYVGSMLISGALMQNKTPNDQCAYFISETSISNEILNEISRREANLHDCLIDTLVRKDNSPSGYEWTKTPYLYIANDGSILGTIIADIDYDNNKIKMIYKTTNIPNPDHPGQYDPASLPSEIRNAVVEVKFYSKRGVTTV